MFNFHARQFNVPSLSTEALQDVSLQMHHNDTLFQQYYRHMRGDTLHHQAQCVDPVCKLCILCTHQWFSSPEEYASCVASDSKAVHWTILVLLYISGTIAVFLGSIKTYRIMKRRQNYEEIKV